ncbi:hypothetical protein Hanom_Chr03g00252061 [Helianthus anomalus]
MDSESAEYGGSAIKPLVGDLIEAKVVHELLCSMVRHRTDGPNNQYVPKIVSVFAEVSCVLIVSSLSQLSFIKCANRLI